MIKSLVEFLKFLLSPNGKLFFQALIQFGKLIYQSIENQQFKGVLKDGVDIAKRNKDPRKLLSVLRKRL